MSERKISGSDIVAKCAVNLGWCAAVAWIGWLVLKSFAIKIEWWQVFGGLTVLRYALGADSVS